ncbi:MAG: hypothetical protein IPK76_01150 [Lewinellaceae bacterium]|nr:hypothetical protein [Lewinellaceae bacterium]
MLIHLFQTHIRKRKNAYFQMSEPARLEWIADAVRSDQRFRNLLVGTIIGHFTVDELRTFEDNEAECLRRLVNLIIQRLQSEDFVCPD